MTRNQLLESIAARTNDYRAGEMPAPTPAHVDRWVKQFPAVSQDALLAEMNHVLHKAYFAKTDVAQFLNAVAGKTEKLTGTDPKAFWQTANFLSIQLGGRSQKHMLAEFSQVLQNLYGFGTSKCGQPGGPYFYLDDVVFSGNRVRHDLEPWIAGPCPKTCHLHIIVIAYHSCGHWFASNRIATAAKAAGKTINVTWWRCVVFEDRLAYTNKSDVLRPTAFPTDATAQQYIKALSNAGHPPVPRTVTNPVYQSPFFGSEQGRQLLEQQMLAAGFQVRTRCPMLPEVIRPLGFSGLKTLGFGSVIVTHRNCPNTCPPALWAGAPWYPLFARKTN
jgi:hypothetical protein